MSQDDELNTARPNSFYGVYILYNKNPKFKGSIYIGFTVNPERRIRQHNREIKGGASKTGRNRGPWDMVLITHGFHTKLAALQFEWAWQNPLKSRRLSHLKRKQSKETAFLYRLRILSEMLNSGPWNRLSLTIQWLKQEYYSNFPVDRPPPNHMPIAYGNIKTIKDRIESSQRPTGCSQRKKAEPEAKTSEETHSVSDVSCNVCKVTGPGDQYNPILNCIVETCSFVAHLKCLAAEFLNQSDDGGSHLLPVAGECPSCKEEVTWADVVKQKRYSLNVTFRESEVEEEDICNTQGEGGSDEDEFL